MKLDNNANLKIKSNMRIKILKRKLPKFKQLQIVGGVLLCINKYKF